MCFQHIAGEMFGIVNLNSNPDLLKGLDGGEGNHYQTRAVERGDLKLPCSKSRRNETFLTNGVKVWNFIPADIRTLKIGQFKQKIKNICNTLPI